MADKPVKVRRLPLAINSIAIPGVKGLIGICQCPGLKEEMTRFSLSGESLINDLVTIHNWGAAAVVTLLEDFEITTLGVRDLPNKIKQLGIRWHHLPIRKAGLPDPSFDELWHTIAPSLYKLLESGKRIVVHCEKGVGRSALVAARILIEHGIPAESAISRIQESLPGSLQLLSQENYCHNLATGILTSQTNDQASFLSV
jgi:ADP-ribosyl-[dinitrogen reductase] hydrolase